MGGGHSKNTTVRAKPEGVRGHRGNGEDPGGLGRWKEEKKSMEAFPRV